MNEVALINVASWEDRFLVGFRASVAGGGLRHCICFASRRYDSRTAALRAILEQEARQSNVELEVPIIDFLDVVQVNRSIMDAVAKLRSTKPQQIVFDISTAPRHLIWGILSELSQHFRNVTLRYTKADSYGDWQTDEDMAPRLVLNCSGIMYPDRPTCLVMLCGPEIARAEKMFYRFEPRRTLILRDTDAASYGTIKVFDKSDGSGVAEEEFNNKDFSDDNLKRLEAIVKPLVGQYNILCSAFGPKLGAVVLFRLVRAYPEIALAYVPAGIHNIELSKGVGGMQDIALAF